MNRPMSSVDCLISCCLIVKNEAANLSGCLDSIQAIADELIVVDTGSKDETVAIAQRYNAKIYHFEWCNDFAAARNFAISKAQGDWILMPDADEKLVTQHPNLRNALLVSPSEVLAVLIPILCPDGVVTEMLSPRLFRNHPSIQYCGQYHEWLALDQQALPNSAMTVIPGIEIIHYGYSLEILPQKSQLRIPMLEEIRRTQGLDLMLLWTLSGMYDCTQQPDHAQSCYEEAMERLFPYLLEGNCPEDMKAVRSWLFELGQLALKNEDFETLRYICWRGIQWCPKFPPLYLLAGLMMKQLGFHLGAIPYFQTCLEFRKNDNYFKGEPFEPTILTVLPAFELGLAYESLGQQGQAIELWQQCLQFEGDFQPALGKLAQSGPLTPLNN